MKAKFINGILALLLGFLLVGCSVQATVIPATAAPPPPVTVAPTATPQPTPITPALPTATAVPPTLTPTSNPHVIGSDCSACHTEEHKSWSMTLHSAGPAAVLMDQEHNQTELLTEECLTCHAPFQTGKYKIGDFVQPVDQQGPWHIVEGNAKSWQAITCTTCHDPTSNAPHKLAFFDSAKATYTTVKDTTELCEKCHQPDTDDSRNLKGSVHEGLECARCHFVPGSNMSLDPKQACAQCHPAINPKHPDVTKLDTTYLSTGSQNNIHFVSCASCHPKGIPTPVGKSVQEFCLCGSLEDLNPKK
jgi:hypothetical protein